MKVKSGTLLMDVMGKSFQAEGKNMESPCLLRTLFVGRVFSHLCWKQECCLIMAFTCNILF